MDVHQQFIFYGILLLPTSRVKVSQASIDWKNFPKTFLVNWNQKNDAWKNFIWPIGYLPWFHSAYCIFNVAPNLVYLEKKFHYVLIDTWVTVLYREYVTNIARYSPVVYTKKFVQLMLRFYWLRSPWQWTDVFQYSRSSRKLVALFVNIDQREKWNPL